ncbi:hypothetical protein HYY69_01020 [Candidatus Woesearchaeota archaeon]|nr:hypothetical protein [Candidatus Woesearchaeota archaeon]
MQEKTITLSALICSGLGIILLYLFMSTTSFPSSYLNKLSPSDLSMIRELNGTIAQIATKNNTTFITLSQENTITVVLFNEPSPLFRKNDKITVVGKVENYQGSYEIIANKVEVIANKSR